MGQNIRGEVLATGEGEIVLEEPLEKSRMLLKRPEDVVDVYFKEEEHHHHPSCVPHEPDICDWEIISRHVPTHVHMGGRSRHNDFLKFEGRAELFLRIMWRVSSPRMIVFHIRNS